MDDSDAPDTLVFSGGGPAALAFVGSLRYLEHTGRMSKVRCMVGSSAGAIVAFLCTLGMGADDIGAWVLERMIRCGLASFDVEGVLELPTRMGLDDGERVTDSLREILRERCGGRTDVTFMELAKCTGKELVVCAANLSLVRHEFFGVETTPDVSVLLALRMSFGVPILFTPVIYKQCVYVDGALFNNLPIDWVMARGASCRVLALNLVLMPPPQTTATSVVPPPTSLDAYLGLLVRALLTRACMPVVPPMHPPVPAPNVNILSIDCTGEVGGDCMFFSVRSLCFEMDDALVQRLIQLGYDVVKTWGDPSIDIKSPGEMKHPAGLG
jgi:predicted acylesterase/phospholipase RssA